MSAVMLTTTIPVTVSLQERSASAVAARAVDATKVYGAGDTVVRALDQVSVTFPSGRFTAVMGPSGSGKSTLLHCVAGLDDLTAGQVFIGEVELGSLSDKQLTRLRREQVGFVFLVRQPQIIFADEPTGNLDSRASAEILGFLRRAVQELDQTIVMVTHDPVAASYADQALFLADGRLVGRMEAPTAQKVLDRIKAAGE